MAGSAADRRFVLFVCGGEPIDHDGFTFLVTILRPEFLADCGSLC